MLKHAHTAGKVTLTPDARELWWHTYPQLTQPADGLLGQLTARAEAHVIRLALLYALLDGQKTIQPEHLHAALALWDYAARSAAWALGQATGDPLAEQIHAALARSPDGLTRTQIRDLCQRNLPADRVEQALARARRRRPRQPATHPHRRPPRRTLDRRASARRLTRHQPRASGSHRSPSRARDPTRLANPGHHRGERSTAKAKRSQTRDAQPRAPDPAALHCKPFPTRRTPLVVRSFASPITIPDGAVITILRVRQQQQSEAMGAFAPLFELVAAPPSATVVEQSH